MISSWSGSSITLPVLASEPLSLGQGMLLMVVLLIVILALIVAGAYVFARVFSSHVRKRQQAWEATATELGLKVDTSSRAPSGLMLLEGVYRGHNVKIVNFRVPEPGGEPLTYVNHISCEICFSPTFAVPFEITSQTRFIKALKSAFGTKGFEIGVPAFDNVFRVVSSDPDSLRKVLFVEPNEAGLPNLLTEMILVQGRNHSVEFSQTSIKISAPAKNTDTARITSIMDDSVLLADRLRAEYPASHNAGSVL